MNTSKAKIVDMTKGNPARLILAFALPMFLGNLFQQLYNLVDCMIVGKFVGSNSLAAVGATGSINFLCLSIGMGIGNGVGVVSAQYFGAGDADRVKKAIGNSVYVVGVVAIIMSMLGFFLADPIMHLLDTPDAYVDESIIYMKITCGCSVFTVAYNTISALLRSLGDSRTPLIFLVISSIINVGLDFLFVLLFDMGVSGVAWATVVSQLVSAVGALIYASAKNPYFKLRAEERRPDRQIILRSFRIGLPMAFMSSTIAISCIALQWVVNGFKEVVGAAFTAINKVEQLVQQPFASIGTALTTYVGQNIGANRKDRVKEGFWFGVKCVAILSVIMFIVPKIWGREIMQCFVNEEPVIELGAKAIVISSSFYFLLGMIYLCRGTLNGMGDSKYALINGVTELTCRIGLSKPLSLTPLGMWSIWVTTGLTWSITGITSLFRYRYKMKDT